MNKVTLNVLESMVSQVMDFRDKALAKEYLERQVSPGIKHLVESLLLDSYKLDATEMKDRRKVIHYTSIVTLLSILNKKDFLRLYDIIHQNDPTEGVYFDKQFKFPAQHHWANSVCRQPRRNAYIVSFLLPDNRDKSQDLIFWRTYGRNCKGCALTLLVPAKELRRVYYGDTYLDKVSRKLTPVLDVLKPLAEGESSFKTILSTAIWDSLETVRYLHKNEAYGYESECRAVVPESSIREDNKVKLEFKTYQDDITFIRHYYEHESFQIDNLLGSGTKITLGAAIPHIDNIQSCVQKLLRAHQLYGPSIEISKVLHNRTL